MKEKRNYLRIVLLVYKSADVLREVIEKKIGLLTFQQFLDNNKHTVYHLNEIKNPCCMGGCARHGQRVLFDTQIRLLYTANPPVPAHLLYQRGRLVQNCICNLQANPVNVADLDMTLLSCLMLNCIVLNPQEKEDVRNLRDYRNAAFHANDAHIDIHEFRRRWHKIESAMLRMASLVDRTYVTEIKTENTSIKTDPIDMGRVLQILREEARAKLLHEVEKSMNELEEKLKVQINYGYITVMFFVTAVVGAILAIYAFQENPMKKIPCPSGYSKCADKVTCILDERLCDGVLHCADGSDEDFERCKDWPCAIGYYKCMDGTQCVHQNLFCDGEEMCRDGSDENPDVCKEIPCPERYSKCKDMIHCISNYRLCDGTVDCEDGSDEDTFYCKAVLGIEYEDDIHRMTRGEYGLDPKGLWLNGTVYHRKDDDERINV